MSNNVTFLDFDELEKKYRGETLVKLYQDIVRVFTGEIKLEHFAHGYSELGIDTQYRSSLLIALGIIEGKNGELPQQHRTDFERLLKDKKFIKWLNE